MALDPKYRAVGFDMDGTFLKSIINYEELANVFFDELTDVGVPPEVIDRTKGRSREIDTGIGWLQENGKAEMIPEVFNNFGKRATNIEMENADLAVLFDGAKETLDALKSKGYKVGILTRGGRKYAEYVLKLNIVLDELDALVARDDYPEDEAKPSPKAMEHLGERLGVRPEEILYVGDHRIDWLTAMNAGSGFYGVLTGHYSSANTWNEMCGTDVPTLDSIKDLLKLI